VLPLLRLHHRVARRVSRKKKDQELRNRQADPLQVRIDETRPELMQEVVDYTRELHIHLQARPVHFLEVIRRRVEKDIEGFPLVVH
jgi:hypothetical protein